MKKNILILFVSFLILGGSMYLASAQISPPPLSNIGTTCHLLGSTSQIPPGFAPPYSVFDAARGLLVQVFCSSSGTTVTVGSGSSNEAIYNTGYKWMASQNKWVPVTLTGTSYSGSTTWLVGNGNANMPSSQVESGTNYVVGYVCTNVNGQWKCGCSDQTCATNQWQLQTFINTAGSGQLIVKKVGEREGSFLVQKINPDSVDGLWYQAYPVATDMGSPKTIRIGDDIGYACVGISEKLTGIDFLGQTITFTKIISDPPAVACPKCLAENTRIDTPQGPVPVQNMRAGMAVWTVNTDGQRIAGIVEKTSQVAVLPTHQLIHLILDDGRELFVSPGHPAANRYSVEKLVLGDFYDGSRIISMDRVSYNGTATYDILPSGETGFYWANNILLGSTLR